MDTRIKPPWAYADVCIEDRSISASNKTKLAMLNALSTELVEERVVRILIDGSAYANRHPEHISAPRVTEDE